jgi:hypothetical protein
VTIVSNLCKAYKYDFLAQKAKYAIDSKIWFLGHDKLSNEQSENKRRDGHCRGQ